MRHCSALCSLIASIFSAQKLDLNAITDDESWEAMLETSETKLCIIDIHLDWCGPCEALMPMWTKMSMSGVKQCAKRVGFYSGEQQLLGEKFKGMVKGTDFGPWAPKGCQPLFMMVRNRHVSTLIIGANTPQIERDVQRFVPPLVIETTD